MLWKPVLRLDLSEKSPRIPKISSDCPLRRNSESAAAGLSSDEKGSKGAGPIDEVFKKLIC